MYCSLISSVGTARGRFKRMVKVKAAVAKTSCLVTMSQAPNTRDPTFPTVQLSWWLPNATLPVCFWCKCVVSKPMLSTSWQLIFDLGHSKTIPAQGPLTCYFWSFQPSGCQAQLTLQTTLARSQIVVRFLWTSTVPWAKISADGDHIVWSKAPEPARKWTMCWYCFVNIIWICSQTKLLQSHWLSSTPYNK